MKKGWKYYASKSMLSVLLKVLSATWRYSEEGHDEVKDVLTGVEPAVIAFLHGQMVPIWYRFRGGKFAAIISGSQDGELLTHYLKQKLGYQTVVRGSSSKGGHKALYDIIRLVQTQSCLITPDGPRGPRGEPKPGALVAAERAGCRIVVVTWRTTKTWDFNTWDRMSVPFPFSKIYIRYCTLQFNKNKKETTTEKLVILKKTLTSTIDSP